MTKTTNAAPTASKLPEKERIKDNSLAQFAHREMVRYGKSVNEDRAVPEFHDGFKPVQRRVLWAAYHAGFRNHKSVEKSARLVGETLGKFHPHGDTACYQAIVNMVNARYPLIDGEGNFGDFFDTKAAAMRYTNVKLSKFSEKVFFDPFYMPITKFVNNYDDKDKEPLYLTALLPNVMFNTTFAIGVGLTAKYPRFTLASVALVLERLFKGEEMDAKACRKVLEFTTQYGGRLVPGQKLAVLELFTKGTARLEYESVCELDLKGKRIVFVGFAPFSNFEKRAMKIAELPEVKSVGDESSMGDKLGRFAVTLKANIDVKSVPEVAKKVGSLLMESESYFNNITIRSASKTDPDASSISLRSTTIPELFKKWAAWRIKLEVGACVYQIGVKDAEIRKVQVMLLAVSNRDLIIKALNLKFDDKQLDAYLSKILKITVEEAQMILDMQVRKLKALNGAKLKTELETLQQIKSTYVHRRDHPNDYCVQHLHSLVKDLQ